VFVVRGRCKLQDIISSKKESLILHLAVFILKRFRRETFVFLLHGVRVLLCDTKGLFGQMLWLLMSDKHNLSVWITEKKLN